MAQGFCEAFGLFCQTVLFYRALTLLVLSNIRLFFEQCVLCGLAVWAKVNESLYAKFLLLQTIPALTVETVPFGTVFLCVYCVVPLSCSGLISFFAFRKNQHSPKEKGLSKAWETRVPQGFVVWFLYTITG